jgi:hypothetical protein
MPERREHYIVAAYAKKPKANLAFPDLIRAAKAEFLKKTVINRQPPPEREVVLVVSVGEFEQIVGTPMEKVFGLVFEEEVLLDGPNLRAEFIVALKGLLLGALRDNHTVKHYGFSVALFIPHGDAEQLKFIYGVLSDLCSEASRETKVGFDIIQDRQELQIFMKNELLKISHGEMKAQYEALAK